MPTLKIPLVFKMIADSIVLIKSSTGVGLEKGVDYSSSLVGAIAPPAAAICSLNAC